jgi:tetratricopeptide (TPR) repeat protein
LDDGLRLEKAGVMDRALEHYERAFEAAPDPRIKSEALRRQAHVYRSRCEWDQALDAARRAADMAQAASDDESLAEAWNAEAAVHQSRGDFDLAVPLYHRMISQAAHARIDGVARLNLASIAAIQQDFDTAADYFRAAYESFNHAGYEWGMAFALNNLGCFLLDRDSPAMAIRELEQAITLAKRIEDLDLVAIARVNYAEALMRAGKLDQAEDAASAAVGHFTLSRNQWRRVDALRVLGDISRQCGDTAGARSLYQAALEAARGLGAKVDQEKLEARLADLEPL